MLLRAIVLIGESVKLVKMLSAYQSVSQRVYCHCQLLLWCVGGLGWVGVVITRKFTVDYGYAGLGRPLPAWLAFEASQSYSIIHCRVRRSSSGGDCRSPCHALHGEKEA